MEQDESATLRILQQTQLEVEKVRKMREEMQEKRLEMRRAHRLEMEEMLRTFMLEVEEMKRTPSWRKKECRKPISRRQAARGTLVKCGSQEMMVPSRQELEERTFPQTGEGQLLATSQEVTAGRTQDRFGYSCSAAGECAAEAIFCCPTENSHHLKS